MKTNDTQDAFYIGNTKDGPLLYPSKYLTTHAVCVGMTGSGKTGLGIALIEEAGLDGIPSIVIDPKGDLGDLMLTFPGLTPAEFQPWVEEGKTADGEAKRWKEGLAASGEDGKRIQKFKDAIETVIYTPASRAGIPLSIISSFKAPPKGEDIRDRVLSVTSSLLGLLGIAADPIKSREHILISSIIDQAWQRGEDLDIASLVEQVQKPPMKTMGALDMDTFFPAKERLALSVSLNHLLASPGFKAWMEGEPLDVQSLLYTASGKPRCAIISIAHLSDQERMFFVTLLLGEFLAWMRRQSGTSSLRALLYMDEIFGYFPPTAMPSSKLPMLTLLKQARAYGVGIVLATQNPVDLDYKGLANCGTWLIGKLQTDRDKARVLEGLQLEGEDKELLNTIGNRKFILRSTYEKKAVLFETRWTLSYLRGPLTLPQIEKLTKTPYAPPVAKEKGVEAKPLLPPGIQEFFAVRTELTGSIHYQPRIYGKAKLHFVDNKVKVDVWQDVSLLAESDDDTVLWGQAVTWNAFQKAPLSGSSFDPLSFEVNASKLAKDFASFLYQDKVLNLYQSAEFGMTSKEDETESAFRARLSQVSSEKREEKVKKIRDKYNDKIAVLTEKVKRAEDKVGQKKQKAWWQAIETVVSFGTTILGALLGKGVTKGTITQTGTSIRRAGKIGKESQDVAAAEEGYKTYQQQLDDLQTALQTEIAQIAQEGDPNSLKIDTITVRPRKSDISVDPIAIAWWPL